MTAKPNNRGVSRDEWFDAALEVLAEGDVKAICIENLATHLGIAKSGFYWHFRNRRQLLEELLEYWADKAIEMIAPSNNEAKDDPKKRVLSATRRIHDARHSRCEIAIQQWARHDPSVAQIVDKVNRRRLEFINEALAELGITGKEADMRSWLYLCSILGDPILNNDQAYKGDSDLIATCIDLLTTSQKARNGGPSRIRT